MADAEQELKNTDQKLRMAVSEANDYEKKYKNACYKMGNLSYENDWLREICNELHDSR